jgi:hypothetical protein
MILLYVLVFLACRCLWFYWDIAKHLTDRKPRDIYVSVGAMSSSSAFGISAALGTPSVKTDSE